MRVADSDYILALHKGARVVNYATFTLYDGTVLNLQPADFRVSGNNYTDKTTDGNSFSVGSFIGKTANICIDNSTGKFDGYDFYMSRFILKESVAVGSNIVKHVSIGNFTVVTDVTPGSIISFSAVDDTYLFDKVHNLSGTKTLKEIIQQACTQCLGSPTFDGTGNFALYNTQIDTNKLDAKLTWRQIVGYVATMTGNNAYIDVNEILKFKWYDFSVFDDGLDGGTFDTNTTPYSDGDTADGGDFTFSESTNYDGGTFTDTQDYHIIQSYKGFNIGTYDISITGVRVVNGDTVVEKPSSTQYNYSYVIEVKDNPLCAGIENTVATHLASILNDLTFRIFSCGILCNPLIEAGDMALVIDTKGIAHRTIINDVSFTTGGFTQVACKAENIIRQQSSYTSEAAKAVVEANRNTERQLSIYDESVQRMNRLAQNSSGLYTAHVVQDDGSVIYYESDHIITYDTDGNAIFTEHSFVCKDAGSGYFYSTDAGVDDESTTWTGGIDRAGNAVLNTIAVFKLTADWIIAGILTDRYGLNYWNLDTGDLCMTSGAKLRLEETDYSGAYVPTMENAPASSWTTPEENDANIGKTFRDTSTGKVYIYNRGSYPESDHPYGANEDKIYLVRTKFTAPIKIKFDSQCRLEAGNYDYLEVYFNLDDLWLKKRYIGSFGGEELVVPTSSFYLVWHTDHSNQFWGFAIDSITATTDSPAAFTSASAITEEPIISDTYVWEELTIDNYTRLNTQREITDNMTQEQIFNALTGGGEEQGIYIYNGKVYLNGQYIKAETISANDIKAGIISDRAGNFSLNMTDGSLVMNSGTFRGLVAAATVQGSTIQGGSININNMFAVDGNGNMTAKSGTIGNLTLGSGALYAYGSVNLVSNKDIKIASNRAVTAYLYKFKPSAIGLLSNFTITIDYTVTYSSNRDVWLYLEYSAGGGSYSTLDSWYLNSSGSGTITTTTFNYTDSYAYRFRIYASRASGKQTLNFYLNTSSGIKTALSANGYTGYINSAEADIGGLKLKNNTISMGDPYGSLDGGIRISENAFKLGTDTSNYIEYGQSDLGHASVITTGFLRIAGDIGTSLEAYVDESNYCNIDSHGVYHYVVNGTSHSGNLGGSSDRRIKEDIQNLDSEMSIRLIDATNTYKFKYKNTDGHNYGVIAQEVREVLDSLGEYDAQLEYESPTSVIPDQRTVQYQQYIPHLINYVKDLRAEINELKAEIKSLKEEK